MTDEKSEKEKIYEEGLAKQELKRKIIQIAKDLFLNPTDEGISPKQKAPSKKQIMAKLTPEEIDLFKKSIEDKLSDTAPESVFWNAYSSNNMELRRKVLLRMVAGDNVLKIEKDYVDRKGKLPSAQEINALLPEDEVEILLEIPKAIDSTEAALMTFSAKDKEYYLRHGTLPPVDREVDTQIQEDYIKYIEKQKPYFEEYIQFIDKLLCELKKYRIVHDTTTLSARIKSSDSALKNDSKKGLDDCFGLEIDFSTEAEKELVEKIIASTIAITKEKKHNKDNGYRAYHCSGRPSCSDHSFNLTKLYQSIQTAFPITEETNGIPNKFFINVLLTSIEKIVEEYTTKIQENLKSAGIDLDLAPDIIPMVEWQFKTIQVAIDANLGGASHQTYKNETTESVQKKYTDMINMFGTIPLSQVPTMWISKLDGQNPRQLSTMETIKKLYPFFINPNDLDKNPPEVPQDKPTGVSIGDD